MKVRRSLASAIPSLCAVLMATIAFGYSHAMAQAAPDTRPATQGTTEADFYKASVPYFRAMLGDLYAKVGHKDPKWDAPAAKFLEDMAAHLAGRSVRSYYRPAGMPTVDSLIKDGNQVLDLGCEDPLVVFCLGELYDQTRQRLKLIELSHRPGSRPGPRRSLDKVSEVLAFRSLSRAESWHAVLSMSKGDKFKSLGVGPLDNTARRHRLQLLSQADKPPEWHQPLIAALDAMPNADPWLRDMLAGRMHIKLAWKSRGGGFANTVTEEGWKGFYDNLASARECFIRAHKLAPELPEAAADMITVAMGGSERLNEDPRKWFALAIAAQPDYRGAYGRLMNAMLPRWGGSYEQMLAVGLKCIEKPRYDTLVPWEFIQTLDTISDDLGEPWAILNAPKIYPLITQVLDGYTKACGPGRGNYFASARVAVAIRTGKLDEARKLQDDWKAAGGQLDWRAFEYFKIKDGPVAAAMAYAYTGKAKTDLAKLDQLLADDNRTDALAAAQAAKAKLDADDPGHVYVDSIIEQLVRQERFAAGEWVRLPSTLTDWRQAEGEWYADGTGGLVTAMVDFRKPKSLLYTGEIDLDPVAGFEISVVVEGVLESANPQPGKGIGPRAGIAFYSMERPFYRGWVDMQLGKGVGEFRFGDDSQAFDVPVRNDPEFTVRCKDFVLTAYLNGKQVGEPFTLPDRYRKDLHVGVGGMNGTSVRFSTLRVRNLTKVKAE